MRDHNDNQHNNLCLFFSSSFLFFLTRYTWWEKWLPAWLLAYPRETTCLKKKIEIAQLDLTRI
jgi:hypothetical protein